MSSVNISDIVITTACRCIIHKTIKSEANNLLKNSVLKGFGYI